MSYQVLSRKWRPQRFEDVLGQEHVVRTLQNAIEKNRVAHAYIFSGPRGVGKTTAARILAKTLNCREKQKATPCNECTSCTEITAGNSLDVLEIDGASNRGIDEIRELREAVKYPPVSGDYRIYIIDEVHMLTQQAFNALLKTLEEPPAQVVFILATTDPQKVPQTILSRTQRFDFRRVSVADITSLLDRILTVEEIAHTDGALQLLARKADGSIRDGLSLLDQVIAYQTDNLDEETVSSVLGLVDEKFYLELLASIAAQDLKAVLGHIESIFERGYDLQEMAQGLTLYLRDALLSLETGRGELTSRGVLIDLPAVLKSADLIALIQISLECESRLRYARQPRVLLEHQWLKMASLDRAVSIQELLGNLGSAKAPPAKAPPAVPSNPAPPVSASGPTESKPASPEVDPVAEQKRSEQGEEKSSMVAERQPRSFRRQSEAGPAGDVASGTEPVVTDNSAVVEQLQAQWPQVMAAIQARSGATAAHLEGSEIAALDDGRLALNLRASEAIHLEMVIGKIQMIQEVISEIIHAQVTVIPTIAETSAAATQKLNGDGNEAVDQLIKTFDGEDY